MTDEQSTTRSTTSADGTTIAYEAYGSGPVAVIVGGAFCDRGVFRELAQALGEDGFTGVTYDRRGRGDSTNTLPYAAEREYEDLAALLGAAGSGTPGLSAFAHGVSSGGALVLGAVAAGVPIVRASVLEVPYRIEGAPPEPPDYIATLSRLGAEGDHEGIVHLFHTQVIGLPEEMLDWMRGTSMWDAMLDLAPTLAYDWYVLGGSDQSLPTQLLGSIAIPVLSINSVGTQIPFLREAAAKVAAAIPQGRHAALRGGFHDVPIPILAPALADFYRS
ncbi:MAG: alpha/beta fold hydrolase [Micrococcales bacterium]|nr:alpha/beta fold hydrolase [Micrococcales bacterium]